MHITKILICGKRCTGKTTLFWDLQKSLGWPMFSVGQYLRDYIRTYQLTPEQMDERSPQISADIDTRIETLLKGPNQVILETRIYGKISDTLPEVLKVLLTASESVRLARAAKREGTSVQKQVDKLIQKENRWLNKMSSLYNFNNFFSPLNYDVTIDTSQLTPQQVGHAILDKLHN